MNIRDLIIEAQQRLATAQAGYDAATGAWVDVWAAELTAAEKHWEAVWRAVRLPAGAA